MQLDHDFKQLFPENESKFLEKWPTLNTRVIKLARQLKNAQVTMLLSMIEEERELEEDQDESVAECLPLDSNGR